MMKYPDIFSTKQVSSIFIEACYKGNSKVVDILLHHPESKYILAATDFEGETGFTRACMMGRLKVLEILLNHKNYKVMLSVKNSQNGSGFVQACHWGKDKIVEVLLNRDIIGEDELYLGFKSACTKNGKKGANKKKKNSNCANNS